MKSISGKSIDCKFYCLFFYFKMYLIIPFFKFMSRSTQLVLNQYQLLTLLLSLEMAYTKKTRQIFNE